MAEPCFQHGRRGDPGSCRMRRASLQDPVSAPRHCVPRRARDDGWWGVSAGSSCAFVLAGRGPPRVCEKKGARAPKHCDPVATNGQPSAPAPVACRAEGAITSSAGLRSDPGEWRRASRVQDLELLRSQRESAAARRASVQGVATNAQPRSAAPESEAELSLASDARDGTDACLNRAPPPPRKAAQLLRPMWTGVRA
jgi:hypothetical protein